MARKTKNSTTPTVENRKTAVTALFLAIAALIVGLAGFVYLYLGSSSVDKHSNKADSVQNVVIERLNVCVDENISPCPTMDDAKWSGKDFVGA